MGIAIGTATQWYVRKPSNFKILSLTKTSRLFNFAFSQITPHAVDNLGWKAFLMFCIFNWSLVFYAFFFVKETTGKSLEEMDALFNTKGTNPDVEAIDNAKTTSIHIENKTG